MEDALFAAGVPFAAKKTLPAMLQDLARVMPASSGMRRWGSAALDLAYVAAGRFDGMWERELKPWDMAAGIVLVREAGGYVTTCTGETDLFESGQILAASPAIHATMLPLLKKSPVGGG